MVSHFWKLEKHYPAMEKMERFLRNYSRRLEFYNHCAFLSLGKVSFIISQPLRLFSTQGFFLK